jgi:DNA-binding beta-propeller fold protein YncE
MAWLDRLSRRTSHILNRLVRSAGSILHHPLATAHRYPAGATAMAAVVLSGIAALAAGCGNQYRPVITPINPTGPASLPSAYITVVSQPGFDPLPAGVTGPCTGVTYSEPSIYTLLDFSGDSVVAQANGGQGPITFSMEVGGADVYSPNCDGTLTTAQSTTASLLTKFVLTSTLLPGSAPTNTLLANGELYVTEAGLHGPTCQTTNCVAQMTGSPSALKQEIPVAPSLINLTGFSTGERMYAISQGNSSGGAQPAWGDCATPSAVTVNGEADAIETTTNTISARLPLGICPVFGFMTTDTLRDFIMNRGSGTVTVINSQLNTLDTQFSPTSTIAVGAGPVYADYYRTGQLLVTANYDGNSITIIDTSLDTFGNDSTTFGKVLATVPVGLHPVELAVLQDGSRVYVANQGDIAAGTPGSVSVVNLTNYTVEKTISLTSNPHAIGAIYNYPIGKVYVASQNSPYLTIIRTDSDIVSDTPEMEGNIVDMHVNAQYPGQSTAGALNYQTESRSVGSGAP